MEGVKESLNEFLIWVLEIIDHWTYKYETFKNTVHHIPGEELVNTYILIFLSGMIAGIGLSLIILWIGRHS